MGMDMLSVNGDSKEQNYLIAGTGAIAGASASSAIINGRAMNLASKTVKAFGSNNADCDAFVKKNGEILTKAIDSKKGFFGKINSAIKDMSIKNEPPTAIMLNTATDEAIDGYVKKATQKLSKKLDGAKLQSEVDKLVQKNITKDVSKSLKNVNKYKNIVIVAASTLGAAALALGAKQLVGIIRSKDSDNEQSLKPQEEEVCVEEPIESEDKTARSVH